MTSSNIAPLLDHIVILIPYAFLSSPPSWFTNLFDSHPGGQHADGLTENTLVLLPDGSYIEFIAFLPGVDQKVRAKHKWGKRKEGIVVDWALTLPSSTSDGLEGQTKAFKKIQEAVDDTKTGLSYGDLVAGGRHRPDGKHLKWAVAAAYRTHCGHVEAMEVGLLPFWCLDDTNRNLRVPYLQDGVARHPAGAVGISMVSVTPHEQEEVEQLDKVYNALLGERSTADDSFWDLKTLAGANVHTGGQIRLKATAESMSLSISLFTNKNEFAGQNIGGRIADGIDLMFEFVSAGI